MSFSSRNHEQGGYDTAQICLNGHVINTYAEIEPEHNKNYCSECGAETITNCLKCEVKIRGKLHSSKYFTLPGFEVPKFCWTCGSPYPWTESKLKAANELISEMENISDEEKSILAQSLDELVKNTTQTEVAAIRIKKIMRKVGIEAADLLKKILVEIMSEAGKNQIWGQ